MLLNEGSVDATRILSEKAVRTMTSNQLTKEMLPMKLFGDPMWQTRFGYGMSVHLNKENNRFMRVGEFGWDGAASTHFWISPKDDLAVVALSQIMPFNNQLENAIKPIVYRWMDEKK